MKSILLVLGIIGTGLLVASQLLPASPGAGKKQRIPVYTETLNSTYELIGPLGRPLGEVITLTATVEEKRYKGDFEDFLTVTSVNGTVLQAPKRLPARLWQWANIREFKQGQHLTLRAYQDGGMIGTPDKAMAETVIVQSQGYAFETWLVVINEVRSTR